MEDPGITRRWMDSTFRVFRRIDVLMPQWASMTMMRLQPEMPTLATVYQRLMRMVLCDEADLRIVNGTVYLLKNDVVCLQLRQFSDLEADMLLQNWFHVFAARTKVGAGHDYSKCLHPRIVETQFPRFELVARFMCMQLRADLGPGIVPGTVDCPYGFGVYYSMLAAVQMLLVDELTRQAAARLHAILTERYDAVMTSWDVPREVYPGYRLDKEKIAMMTTGLPDQKKNKHHS